MTGPGDWVTPSQNVSAPPFIGPNAPGIILGPDVPPCMSTTYSAVWRFQPDGAATGGLNAPPALYFGQVLNTSPAGNETVDVGYLVYDGATVCGFMIVMRYTGQNRIDGTGTIWAVTHFGGFTGPSTLPQFRNEFNFGDTDGAIGAFLRVAEVNINKGDPLTRQPNPRNTLFTIDSVSAPRGLRGYASSTVNSGGLIAETVVLTTNNFTMFNSRAYEVLITADLFSGVAADIAAYRVRRNNVAGTMLRDFVPYQLQNNAARYWAGARTLFVNTSGADVTDTIVLTLQGLLGNNVTQFGSAQSPRTLEVRDLGAAADYPNLPSL